MAAEAAAAGGVSVFPGWEFFTPVAGAERSLLTLLPRCALFVDEPAMVRNQIDRWWSKVELRHERSGIGSLVRPEDIYLRPKFFRPRSQAHMGLDLDQLGAIDVLDDDATLGEIELPTRPTLRFHGSIPALTEQLKTLMANRNAHRPCRAASGRRRAPRHRAARLSGPLPSRQPRSKVRQRHDA